MFVGATVVRNRRYCDPKTLLEGPVKLISRLAGESVMFRVPDDSHDRDPRPATVEAHPPSNRVFVCPTMRAID